MIDLTASQKDIILSKLDKLYDVNRIGELTPGNW